MLTGQKYFKVQNNSIMYSFHDKFIALFQLANISKKTKIEINYFIRIFPIFVEASCLCIFHNQFTVFPPIETLLYSERLKTEPPNAKI